METNTDINISASTRYRYDRVNRKAELPAFLHFKQQFQHYFDSKKIQAIKKVYHHGVCGRNQHKHTVVVDRVGNMKMQELSKLFEEDELVYYINQRLLHLSETVMQQREQLIWIIDLSGKIMQLASKRIMDALQKIIVNAQRFFPDILHKLVFVNTPMLFDTIWSKITPHMAKETLDKVVMIGDEIENIYQFAEQAILPDFLGGDVDEDTFLNDYQHKDKDQQESSSEEQFDFSSLKQALSGLKTGGHSLQSVSQTPLNTEADES